MKKQSAIALFGEAEKGEIGTLLCIKSLVELYNVLGNPPDESRAIFFAVQFLSYQHELIFIRVREEGFSTKDYLKGIQLLLKKKKAPSLNAICLPGVGDGEIIDATIPILEKHQALFITTEKDLYDYLTFLHS